MTARKTILIAPLDWGLGHATRCMPVIDSLLSQGHRVIVAGNGDSFCLLKEQYPDISSYELPGYNISYPAGKNASFYALLQTPKILRTIKEENKAIASIAAQEQIDLIISDNRYGVRHNSIKSILICHQIALQAPPSARFMNPVFLKLHLRQIEHFDALWIPDEEGNTNLSGKLSHGISFTIPTTYIGILSRFSTFTKTDSLVDKLDFSILIVLSGQEPQRTHIEKELKNKLKDKTEKILLVQGKTERQNMLQEDNITIISYLNTNDLFTAIQKATKLICRSGYSTIMDLAVLGKKAIFIPAEGQTEQEFLAAEMEKKGYAVHCPSKSLNIEDALRKVDNCKGFPVYPVNNERLRKAIDEALT